MDVLKKYGFSVLIDFHQDVWSRFTGGSGAPMWTLENMGLKIENLQSCLASIGHQKKGYYPLGHLSWATNADRYAAKTMYTLFFGGNYFAKSIKIEGKNVQDYYQDHYIEAVSTCVKNLKGHNHIIGYDIMNEPHLGYIGCKDLRKYHGLFQLGPSPLPLQGFALSEGVPQTIAIFEKKWFKIKTTQKKLYNPKGESIWKDGKWIWRKLGVWDYELTKPRLIKKNFLLFQKS